MTWCTRWASPSLMLRKYGATSGAQKWLKFSFVMMVPDCVFACVCAQEPSGNDRVNRKHPLCDVRCAESAGGNVQAAINGSCYSKHFSIKIIRGNLFSEPESELVTFWGSKFWFTRCFMIQTRPFQQYDINDFGLIHSLQHFAQCK